MPPSALRHEDLARERQTFAELRLFVHLVRHVRAPDEDGLGILLDERMEAEERPAASRAGAAARLPPVAAPAAASAPVRIKSRRETMSKPPFQLSLTKYNHAEAAEFRNLDFGRRSALRRLQKRSARHPAEVSVALVKCPCTRACISTVDRRAVVDQMQPIAGAATQSRARSRPAHSRAARRAACE